MHITKDNQRLNNEIMDKNRDIWRQPTIHSVDSDFELEELKHATGSRYVIDAAVEIADDLFELHNTNKMDDHAARADFVRDIESQGAAFGSWVQYPWSDTLVRFPEEQDYYDLRTFRNKNLVTHAEQQQLRSKKIAAFGMSVGSNVIDSAVQSGIGNEYLLFDYDRLSIANLNRIRATMAEVGLYKTIMEGRKIAELDPYIKQQHFTEGYGPDTDAILRRERPDMMIEEVDDITSKARIRQIAAELGIPLVMAGDVGDISTLDIERHDLGAVKPFNGKLSTDEFASLVDGTARDKDGMLMKMVGMQNLTTRLIDSAMLRDEELAGLPQLGTTATVGGALASVAVRDILLGRTNASQSRKLNIRKSIGSSSPSTPVETLDTLKRYASYRANQKKGAK